MTVAPPKAETSFPPKERAGPIDPVIVLPILLKAEPRTSPIVFPTFPRFVAISLANATTAVFAPERAVVSGSKNFERLPAIPENAP